MGLLRPPQRLLHQFQLKAQPQPIQMTWKRYRKRCKRLLQSSLTIKQSELEAALLSSTKVRTQKVPPQTHNSQSFLNRCALLGANPVAKLREHRCNISGCLCSTEERHRVMAGNGKCWGPTLQRMVGGRGVAGVQAGLAASTQSQPSCSWKGPANHIRREQHCTVVP